mgnify:CR=1 FL=1
MSLRDDAIKAMAAHIKSHPAYTFGEPEPELLAWTLDGLLKWLRENKPRITAEMRLWTDGIGSLCDLLGGEA